MKSDQVRERPGSGFATERKERRGDRDSFVHENIRPLKLIFCPHGLHPYTIVS